MESKNLMSFSLCARLTFAPLAVDNNDILLVSIHPREHILTEINQVPGEE